MSARVEVSTRRVPPGRGPADGTGGARRLPAVAGAFPAAVLLTAALVAFPPLPAEAQGAPDAPQGRDAATEASAGDAGPTPRPSAAAESATAAPGAADPASRAPAADAPDPFRRPSTGVLEARRKRFLDSLGTGVALIRSSSPRDLESAYPQASDFRQDNDFLYFTGLETPDSWLLMAARPGGGAAQVLFIPERDTSRERWTGKKPGPREASRVSGIGSVRHTSEFEKLVRSGQISSLGGGGPLHLPLSEDALCSELMRALTGASPEVRDVDPVVARVRLVKDEFELQQLRRAVELTDRAQRAAMAAAEPGIWEYELEAVIEYEFRRGGAERVGFPSIVGSGPNSVVLHYDKNRRKTRKGDLVVMDVGAEYSYYTADVTRTIPVSGRFTERQRELYELVLGAQEAGIEAVRPGATMSDVARAARTYMRRNSGDLCGRKTCDEHFTHGVGHWLGMDVHDVGSYSTPFRPGMVLTVEPGVYLPEEDLGIRIEDDVLVTEDGREVLSKAPKTVEDVEAAMAGEPAGRPAPATGSREGARVGG